MKTITILALHLSYGGVEKYISSLCKMLHNDYKIRIISTYNNDNKTAFEFDKNVEIKEFTTGKIKPWASKKSIEPSDEEKLKIAESVLNDILKNIRVIKIAVIKNTFIFLV